MKEGPFPRFVQEKGGGPAFLLSRQFLEGRECLIRLAAMAEGKGKVDAYRWMYSQCSQGGKSI